MDINININISRATMDDLTDVVELFDQYRIFYGQVSECAAANAFLSERIGSGDSVIFIARDERNRACGFTQLYPTFSSQSMQRMWILNDLYVAEPYRKCGVASKLLESARAFSFENAAKGLQLCTQVTNLNAQALYKKSGYRKIEDFEWYFLKTT